MSILKMRDLTSKAEVLETYAELFDVFDDNKEICKELCKVYDKIMGLPTIDAVPVVRCKDCKNKEMCRAWTIWASPPPDDWFCKDGERRGE